MRRTTIYLVALAFAGVLPTLPAGADNPTHCTFTIDVIFSPGFSQMKPTSGSFTSNGETGTMECDGPVNGKQPTGPGTLGNDGNYGTEGGDTCTSGTEGLGVDFATIPTSDGHEKIVSKFRFTGGDLSKKGDGIVAGEFSGDHFSGTFEATPIKGDCITAPITVLRAVGEGVLH